MHIPVHIYKKATHKVDKRTDEQNDDDDDGGDLVAQLCVLPQTVLGAVLFGDQITSGRVSGIGIILAGSIYYTWVKDQEVMQPKAPAETKHVRLHQLNRHGANHDQREEMDSLIVKINEDEDEDDELGAPSGDYNDRLESRNQTLTPTAKTSPLHDEDDDQEEDEDLRELRKAEQALGL